MTVLCGGGTSQAKPGFGASVSIGIAQLAALLNNVPTPVAFALAGYLGLISYDLSTFCTIDPPPMPIITAGDWVAALTISDPVAHFTAIDKFVSMFSNLLWPTFCECTSGPQPPTPALPTPPTNLPTVEPPALPTGPISGPCWDFTSTFSFVGTSSANTIATDKFVPVTGTPIIGALSIVGISTTTAYPIPSGMSNLHGTANAITDLHVSVEIDVYYFQSNGTFIATQMWYGDHDNQRNVSLTPPAGAAYWLWAIGTTRDGQNVTFESEVIFNCGGTSQPTLTTACCPPDPSQTAMLQELLALVRSLFEGAPVPLTSYADSTAHTGLSGNGTVTIGGNVLAVRVDITVDPTTLSLTPGDPSYLPSRGFIVPVVNSAPIRGDVQLVYNPQMYLLPQLTEQVGYSLHPGVVATITELVRGP
jgi:hypothetical protein